MTVRPWIVALALAGCHPVARPGLPLHPLAAGARWTYDVTIDRALPSEVHAPSPVDLPVAHHAGVVTWSIAAVRRVGRAWVADLVTEREPPDLPARPVARLVQLDGRMFALADDRPAEPLIAGGGRGAGLAEVLRDPPEAHPTWGADAPSRPGYGWRLVGRVAWGAHRRCARVAYLRGPDHTEATYCPGVGLVEWEYVHHGTVDHERWVLRRFDAPCLHTRPV